MTGAAFVRRSSAEILNAFDRTWMEDLISSGAVSDGPEAAFQRLCLDGEEPDRLGSNCPAIHDLRELVDAVSDGEFSACALMITAPHTHWAPGAILETFDPDLERYWIGPPRVFESAWPVSFAFTAAGACPYEWADQTVPLSVDELRRAYDLIAEVADRLAQHPDHFPLPVGLSVNHRFKRIGGPALFSTMEVADPDSGRSYVVPDTFSDATSPVFSGQVGWPVATMRPLSPTETAAFTYLERRLAALPYEDAAAVFERLSAADSEDNP